MEDGHSYLMLRINQNDSIPMAMSSKLVSRPWPTLQRDRAIIVIKKSSTSNRIIAQEKLPFSYALFYLIWASTS
jgi:hypothetical protein